MAWIGVVSAPAALASINLEQVGGVFEEATFVTSPPDGPNRVLVVERPGKIEEVNGDTTSPFLDLTGEVAYANDFSGFEKGLFSIAFAPDYATSHAFYAIYTSEPNGEIELDEFKTDESGTAIEASRRQVLTIPHPTIHHYGGQLQFGPEGDLYISVGDGSVDVAPADLTASQNLDSLLGKILRIDPRPDGFGDPYTIPADNPFVGETGKRGEIWSYGFRNPWRFSFDSANGALAIGDVGNEAREEVDYTLPAGGEPAGRGVNYGWPCREGASVSAFSPTAEDGCPLAPGSFTDPTFTYGHEPIEGSSASACAVMGGYVAHDPSLGDVDGRYLYADLCTAQIRSFVPGNPVATDRPEAVVPPVGSKAGSPDSFGEDSCGRIYVATSLGRVFRLAGAEPRECAPPSGEEPGEEEPAGEGSAGEIPNSPPPATAVGAGPTTVAAATAPAGTVVPAVKLAVVNRPRHPHGWFTLRARVTPCPPDDDGAIVLRRGGRALATHALGPGCLASFRVRPGDAALIATAVAEPGYAAASSAPLRISTPPPGHRSPRAAAARGRFS